ncbi:MAG: toxin-antitoxin system HicB family antitoxin, partial [Gemmatimonadetes bacterium]|nr:toxin-antitoxin system HicB family antitoxin [Gemmatimonadota bacterium]
MIDYKGYTGVFDYDPEAECFSGHVVDLRDEIYFEGASVPALKASLKRAVDHYLIVCEQRGE